MSRSMVINQIRDHQWRYNNNIELSKYLMKSKNLVSKGLVKVIIICMWSYGTFIFEGIFILNKVEMARYLGVLFMIHSMRKKKQVKKINSNLLNNYKISVVKYILF